MQTCKDLRQDFVPFVKDSIRVIVAFIAIIELAPLQIYGSSIFFSPTGSIVRQRFWHQRIPKTGEIYGVEAHWSARLQVIRNSSGPVRLHVFSPNYHFLASAVERAFCEYEIRLRDINIGTHLYALPFTGSRIEAIAFSADSRHLAAADLYGHIRLWDVESGHTQQIDLGFDRQLAAIRFSSNLNFVISVSEDGMVQFWERLKNLYREVASRGRNVIKNTNEGTSGRVIGYIGEVRLRWATLSPCMQLLAYQTTDNPQVQIWDFAIGKQKSTKRYWRYRPEYRRGGPVGFSLDSRLLAIGYVEMLAIWDVRTGAQNLLLQHDHPVDAIAFSPCGRIIASSAREKIQIWNLQNGISETTLIEDGSVSALAFTLNGSTLASPQHLWDTTKPRKHHLSGGGSQCITRIVISPDRRLLASASRDRMIRIWDASTLVRRWMFVWHAKDILRLSFSPDSKLLASLSKDKHLCIWSMKSGALEEKFPSSISDIAYSPDGQIVASTYWLEFGGEVALWEAETGRLLRILDGTRKFVESKETRLGKEKELRGLSSGHGQSATFANPKPAVLLQTPEIMGHTTVYSDPIFSPDGHSVAAIRPTGSLDLWEVSTGRHRQRCPIDSPVNKILYSPDSELIAALGFFEVFLWRITALESAMRLEIEATTAGFFPDGNLFVTAGSEVTVWDVTTGSRQHTLGDLKGSPMVLCASPDGRLIAVSSNVPFVRVWNITSRPESHFTMSQRETVTTMAFSPDGKLLATASEQGLIGLWETSSGTQLRWTMRQEGLVRGIKFLPDELVVSVSDLPPFFNLWNDMKLRIYRYRTASITTEKSLVRFTDDTGLKYEADWIKQGSKNLLWVPPQYRPTDGSAQGWISENSATILIGSVSGHVIRFQCV